MTNNRTLLSLNWCVFYQQFLIMSKITQNTDQTFLLKCTVKVKVTQQYIWSYIKSKTKRHVDAKIYTPIIQKVITYVYIKVMEQISVQKPWSTAQKSSRQHDDRQIYCAFIFDASFLKYICSLVRCSHLSRFGKETNISKPFCDNHSENDLVLMSKCLLRIILRTCTAKDTIAML